MSKSIRIGLITFFSFVIFSSAAFGATIQWYGHSFFKIKDDTLSLVIDPFDDSLKYYLPKKDISADGLLISKNSFDHNNSSIIDADTVMSDLGATEINGVRIKAFQVYSDDEHGILRGTNLVFNWESEGINYLFLGDIGEDMSESMYKAIGKVDVIFVPVGGTYTLELDDAKRIIERTGAKVIIPMHYKTALIKYLWISLYKIDKFKEVMGEKYPVIDAHGMSLTITSDKLPKVPMIYLLDYPHTQKEVDSLR